jgi:hypothetical protein
MFAASNEQDFLCRVFGRTLCGGEIDREVLDLMTPPDPLPDGRLPGPVQPKLFTYVRYNAELTRAGLDELGLPHVLPEHVQALDVTDHLKELRDVGDAVASAKVKAEHFAGFPALLASNSGAASGCVSCPPSGESSGSPADARREVPHRSGNCSS